MDKIEIALLVVGVWVVLAVASSSHAQTIPFCIGEWEHNCGYPHTAFFGCGTNADDAARTLCTVNNPDGTRTISKYRLVPRGATGGNRCGYAGFEVTCLD